MMMALCFCMLEAPESQATTFDDYTHFDYTKVQRGDTITGFGTVSMIEGSGSTRIIHIIDSSSREQDKSSFCGFELLLYFNSGKELSIILREGMGADASRDVVIPKKIGDYDVGNVELPNGSRFNKLDISQTNVTYLRFNRDIECKYLILNKSIAARGGRGIKILYGYSEGADKVEYVVIPKGDTEKRTIEILSKYGLDNKVISQNDFVNYIENASQHSDKGENLVTNKSQRKMGNYIYAYIDTDTCRVISYSGDKETLNIPKQFDKKKVVEISDNFLSKNDKVKTLTIPDTVTEIDSKAFNECTKLSTVNMSTSIEKIGSEAFNGCTELTTISFPESLKTIGARAFKGCTKLASVTIPKNVTKVGESAFEGCSALATVKINSNGADFTQNVFRSTLWLKGKTDALVVEGNSFIHKNKDVEGEYTVPTGCTVIPDWVFCKNAKLTKITIPNTVTSIGNFAFLRCNGLKELTIPGSVKEISEASFGECGKLEKVVISEGVEALYGMKKGKYNGMFDSEVYDPIGQNAFKELYLPGSVK